MILLGDSPIYQLLNTLKEEFGDSLNMEGFEKRFVRWYERQNDPTEEKVTKKLTEYALNSIDIDATDWTFVAARSLLRSMYSKAQQNRGYRGKPYGSFYSLIKQLSKPYKSQRYPVYKSELLESYSESEINELGNAIDPEKDKLFNYIGLFLINDRYLATPVDGEVFELPQERFMIIAMELMREEPKDKRIELIKESYWALSNLYMTVATPTLANAGKTHGQLSSCFIDTVSDSIDGIYLGNYDEARVSKFGGGVGIYFGKVRALGSDIRDYPGNSSGTTPWIRLFNQTAISVDQLGQRQGAFAIYLDVFHKDITNGFLELKTNNGDERTKAHDIFTGVSIPDLFMEKLEEKDKDGKIIGEWYTFDPHTLKKVLGFGLEDYFDEEVGQGSFRDRYYQAVQAAEDGTLPFYAYKKVKAIDIMKPIMVSQLEEGVPYMFYRDEVNRKNPNKQYHPDGTPKTSIYCSNLCTEIAQNMSPTEVTEEYIDEDENIVMIRKPGDYVVCNLSSINLPRAVKDDVLNRLIPIQVRMLDNVIDVNTLPVLQAKVTNKRYRAIGLGTFGWHHLLAEEGIYWESEESVEYADKLYEEIAYLTIKSSNELAKEKGSYRYFEGSDWHSGKYFTDRYTFTNNEGEKQWTSKKWAELAYEVANYGLRNGHLMAVAPNSSTAKIGGSTDGIDPLYEVEYYEEKKNFKFKVTAPGLNHKTYPYYLKTRFNLDQKWSIRQNAKRQKHIDQAISFNMYVRNSIPATELLDLHMTAWKNRLKTSYYLRSTSNNTQINDCEACQS